MPSSSWYSLNEAAPRASRQAPGGQVLTSRVQRDLDETKVDNFGGFFHGAADTITFGFLDEAGAWVDSLVYGYDYEERLAYNRALLGRYEEETDAYFVGQIAGGLVPGIGILGRAKGLSTTSKITLGGAGYGAAYGFGSANGDFSDRLRGSAVGGLTGALGGYLLGGVLMPLGRKAIDAGRGLLMKRGADVDLTPELLPKLIKTSGDDAPVPVAQMSTPKAGAIPLSPATPTLAVRPAVQAADELTDGALITVRELLGDPGRAAEAVARRIGKLSTVEASALLKRVEAAEASGTIASDPHYRSLLMVDMTGEKLDADAMVRAAELFEEATEQLAARAGIKPRTVKGMEQEVARELKKGVTLGELDEAYEASKKGFVQTRIAQHVMVTAAAKVVRLREELLPKLVAGEQGIRELLAEELTDAAHRFVLARGILSNAGRQLGILSKSTKARTVEVLDDLYDVESVEAIRARVNDALSELGDGDIKQLLGRIRSLSDAENLERILLDPVEAKAFTTWNRTVNSVSLFLRSNALTPATALFNTIGFVANDFFRNHAAKRWAAKGLTKAGRVDEALALRLEESTSRAVYGAAHKAGLQALLKRVQWEFWTDVERIAGVGWGSGKVAEKARLKQGTMLGDGYVPPALREFKERGRLNITDTTAFNQRLDSMGDSAFARLVYHLERARAVTANTVDALGGASMRLFTGAVDDWGREFVRVKETMAQATRFAVREAVDAKVAPDQLAAVVQRRAKELAEMPTADLLDRVESALVAGGDLSAEASFLTRLHKMVDEEADSVLFMDGPQSALGKTSSNFLSSIDRLGLVLPYVRTPIRLFEQGVVNYGPMSKLSKEVQDILKRGKAPNATPDERLAAQLEEARVEIGTTVFQTGLVLGLTGGVTATNGGFDNSGNLDAGPPNRINFPGGGFVEFGRFDPFSFTVGMGALIGQAFREGYADGTEYDQEQALRTGLATAFLGARDSILDKSYLKGLEDLVGVLTSEDVDAFGRNVEKILQNAAARFVPLAGIGRQFNETFRSSSIESVGFIDTILRSIPGAGYGLSPKVDALGDEVKSRTLGLNFGNSELTEGEAISPVKAKLRELGIDISTIRKSDPDGFNLTSEELSEVRRIRGKEAVNDQGLTMEEALQDLFEDPWFQSLPSKDQKRAEIVELMREFNKPAWEILMERSPSYASKKTYTKSLQDYIAEGMSRKQAEGLALDDTSAAGLPAPEL